MRKRNYSEAFLKFGFICSGSKDTGNGQCVLCMEDLSAESMKPSKLKRHFEVTHPVKTKT